MKKQILQVKENQKVYEPFFHKRKAFKHEAEVRVLIDDKRWYNASWMRTFEAKWKIDEKDSFYFQYSNTI